MYDPEKSYTPKGSPGCTFPVASNRYFKREEEASYLDVAMWSCLL